MLGFGGGEGILIGELPTTSPLSPRDIRVPVTVIAGAFEVRVAPAMATPLESKVTKWPAAFMTSAGKGDASGVNAIVLDPIRNLELPRDTIVPSMLMAGSLGLSVWPAPTITFDESVSV